MGLIGSATPQALGIPFGTWPTPFPQKKGQWTHPNGAMIVPTAALDRWFAYRQTKGGARGEVIVFGDSTTYGSGALYSWLQRMRDNASGVSTGGPAGFGITDGGKGIIAGGESSIGYDSPEINGFVSSTFGGGFPDVFDPTQGQFWYDTGSAAGHTLNLQFKGTCCRIWYMVRGNAGQFTYSLDGGAAVTVNANGSPGQIAKFVYLSGLSAGTHTLTITNLAGAPIQPPTINSALPQTGTGTLAAGTYYYVATTYDATNNAESVISAEKSATLSATGEVNFVFLTGPPSAGATTRIYRSTTSGSGYQLVATCSTNSNGTYTGTDTGTAGGAAPVQNGGLSTVPPACYIGIAPMNATGLSWQKFATSGATFNNFNGGWKYWSAFGLTAPSGSQSAASSYSVDTSQPVGGAVTPVLAILDLGFNDLTDQANTDYSVYTNGIDYFAACCQAAGVDGIVCSGQLPYNANWPTYGAAIFNAMKAEALAKGLAFVDLFYPVGGPSLSYAGGTQNPHLGKGQYQAQADFLWNNLLGLVP